MKLRSHLMLLTLATLLPVALFAAAVTFVLAERERDAFRQGALDRVDSILVAADTELLNSITSLEAVATLRSLDAKNLAGFREDARRVLESQRDWANIHLALPSGQQVMNLRRPPGQPLPVVPDTNGIKRVVENAAPVVGDLTLGPVTREINFAVRVPVIREGRVKYVLSAIVRPEAVARFVLAQKVPPGAVVGLLDRNHRFLARSLEPEKSLGKPASPTWQDAIGQAPSGWYRGTTLEGAPVYTAYARSEFSGWTFGIGYPKALVDAGAWRAAEMMAVGVVLAIMLAVLLAALYGQRIAHPMAALAAMTQRLARGEPLRPLPQAPVEEVQIVAQGLQQAAGALSERTLLLEREKNALKAADVAKNEFIAMLSHELRNPLSGLTSAAHVLKTADPSAEMARQARDVIERQTAQMRRLIEELLDVSRVTMGKITLEREPLNLAELVYTTATSWRVSGRFDRHRATLDTSPVWLRADRARLEQIIVNLLDNASKFTPPGKLIAVRVAQEKGEAMLEVRDEGQGLPADMLERVFDLFVQGKQGIDRSRGGMGVGLALVRRLVEMQGGTVAAVSEGTGHGTAFIVRFPAIEPPREAPQPRPAEDARSGLQLLVVEDNDDAGRMISASLALNGHQVREARDGAGGIALAAQGTDHAALIDIGLPDMTGYEVAHRIRSGANGARMVLVALTGYGQPQDRRLAIEAGFDAHLTKPVTVEQIEKILVSARLRERRV